VQDCTDRQIDRQTAHIKMSAADAVRYLKQVISFHSNYEEFNNTLNNTLKPHELHKLNTSNFQPTKDQDF